MEYTYRRTLDKRLRDLEANIYTDIHKLDQWQTMEEKFIEAVRYEKTEDWRPIAMGDHWKCGDAVTRRFRALIDIPKEFVGKQAVLVLDVGGEGLVRIDGEIISGITSYVSDSWLKDRMRTRVYLPDEIVAKGSVEVEVEACLNFLEFIHARAQGALYEEYTFRTAFIAMLNEDVEAYYFDIRTAIEAMDTFANPIGTLADLNAHRENLINPIVSAANKESFLYERVADAVVTSLAQLDLDFDHDTLCASIPKAQRVLAEKLESIPYKAHAKVKFVGQAHIDTAWLWPLKESVRKCGKTFANQLALMKRYPEFIFSFSQPQLFEYTEIFYPELFEEIKKRVADGHIELVGNAWVEMDTNVPSGESLVRQLLYGRQYYLEKFGVESKVFWMPDVFGYTWALPQIMKRSGVDYFFTSKLVNNDTNRFPHSLFLWQGTDGTQILSYLQRLNYNGVLCADTLSRIYDLFDQKAVCDTSLMTIGYGDGGGGPSYQMLESAKRLKNFPGLPESEFATSLSFFEDAEKVQDNLPVWNDEMYYEFHRGTYTSQANTKKNNRKSELFLRKTEMACVLAQLLLGKDYPARAIGTIYKKMLTNQFHDILPGSSIQEVYDDCDKSYAEVFNDAQAIYDEAIQSLNGAVKHGTSDVIVWNFLSWPRTGPVSITAQGVHKPMSVTNGKGVILPSVCEDTTDGMRVTFIAEVPAMGYSTFNLIGGALPDGVGQGNVMENEYLKLTLDANGNIEKLYDKSAWREVVTGERPSNLLTIFADSPHGESAWNIDLEYQNKYWELEKADSVQWIEDSDVRQIVRVVRTFGKSTIEQDIVLYKNSPRVNFETRVDWYETERMLKAAFYPDVLSPKATYEIQYGSIERPTHWNTSYDKARFEVCGHKWADLSEGNYGVSLINDCKYGYDIKDNRMRLTLLRSPNYPDPDADKGHHEFVYSFYPHAQDWRTAKTVREAYELNVPLEAYSLPKENGTLVSANSLMWIEKPSVVIEAIKGAEDGNGLIVRAYEANGTRGEVKLCAGFAIDSACECNLMEVDEEPIEAKGREFSFTIKPYEIKTFRVIPKQ